MAGLGSLLDKFQGFFSKGFFVTGMLPAIILMTLNIILTYWVFPSSRITLYSIFLSTSTAPLNWPLLFLLLLVLALVFWSLNPLFRQFMEGQYLPRFARHALQTIQHKEMTMLINEREKLLKDIVYYREVQKGKNPWMESLKKSRQKGELKTVDMNKEKIAELVKQDRKFRMQASNWELISFDELKVYFEALDTALQNYPASKVTELDSLHVSFQDLLEFAVSRIEIPVSRKQSELSMRFPNDKARLSPTRLGNFSEVHREYGLKRYGLDVEVLWLRLMKLVKNDEKFYALIDDTKTQLDFSLAITTGLGVTVTIWLFLSMLFALNPYPFIVIASVGPLLTLAFYKIIQQNYRTFTEGVRGAIDLYRFELLTALHIELPSDSDKEKVLWASIMSYPNAQTPITYTHNP